MNVILIVLDTLNRTYLTPYGAKNAPEIQTPNFDRLARKCVTMDSHWAGSFPTMPTRHELLAGRHEYPWRFWGPLEPFDLTIPQLAAKQNVVSMLITDTYHYFLEGSGNYHTDFSGYEFLRGHESDHWITAPIEPPFEYRRMLAERKYGRAECNYMRNSAHRRDERDFYGPRVMDCAARWLDDNHTHTRFFLMVDSFDPHEPWHVPPPYDRMYDPDYMGEYSVWRAYGPTAGMNAREVQKIRAQYMGKITMLDKWMGLVLDRMDRYDLWDNTMLIVTTDHGNCIGEHDYIGKNYPILWDIVMHIPLFIWMPGMKLKPGTKSKLLTSQIDIYPTILQALDCKIPADYVHHGYSLIPALKGRAQAIRSIAHGGHCGMSSYVTDGRWVLHKMPATAENQPYYEYGINMEGFHKRSVEPYVGAETGQFLPYTPATVYRVHKQRSMTGFNNSEKGAIGDLLFELRTGDADLRLNRIEQQPKVADRLRRQLAEEYQRLQVPAEQYERLGLVDFMS